MENLHRVANYNNRSEGKYERNMDQPRGQLLCFSGCSFDLQSESGVFGESRGKEKKPYFRSLGIV